MALDELLQPGQSVRIFFNKGNINNARIHIRAIVDDDWIVYRKWSRHKQDWRYIVELRYYFEVLDAGGNLLDWKKSPDTTTDERAAGAEARG